MAVKLHRCPNVWVKLPGHPCWRVQKELDAAGVDYELAKEPVRRGKRTETIEKTGQNQFPWIEFEDGGVLREESKDLAERIKSGRLFEGREGAGTTPAAPPNA
jgi:hypothetical protein